MISDTMDWLEGVIGRREVIAIFLFGSRVTGRESRERKEKPGEKYLIYDLEDIV